MASTPTRILVPTDFSASAENALGHALRLAGRFDAELHVLHVRVLLDGPHLEERQQQRIEDLLASADRQTREVLSREADATPPLRAHPHLVRGISAAEAIVEFATELGCELIVMGTHGRRGLKRLLLGSVAEVVVRTAPVPVLTVHPDAPRERMISNILLAHDFSLPSLEAVELAARWARALDAGLTLLHVIEPAVYPEFYAVDLLPDDLLHRVHERAQNALDEIADEHLAGLSTVPKVAIGQAADTIVEEAQGYDHDLVIMGKRGLSDIEHILLGSVVDKVLRRSTIPVLTVRTS